MQAFLLVPGFRVRSSIDQNLAQEIKPAHVCTGTRLYVCVLAIYGPIALELNDQAKDIISLTLVAMALILSQ